MDLTSIRLLWPSPTLPQTAFSALICDRPPRSNIECAPPQPAVVRFRALLNATLLRLPNWGASPQTRRDWVRRARSKKTWQAETRQRVSWEPSQRLMCIGDRSIGLAKWLINQLGEEAPGPTLGCRGGKNDMRWRKRRLGREKRNESGGSPQRLPSRGERPLAATLPNHPRSRATRESGPGGTSPGPSSSQ